MSGLAGPLAYPLFRRLALAANLSEFGFTVLGVASAYLVFQMTGDTTDVGILAALAIVPGIVGPAVTATLMERFCPRKMATGLSLFKALAPAVMAVLYASGDLTVGWIFVLVLIGVSRGRDCARSSSSSIPTRFPRMSGTSPPRPTAALWAMR